jgi:UPF0755 protein
MSGLTLQDLPSAAASRSERREDQRERRDRRRRRRNRTFAVLLVCLAVFGAAGWLVSGQVREVIDQINAPTDYTGTGTGTAQVQIPAGASGRTIGRELAGKDVILTPGAFLDAASKNPKAGSIQPGTYALHHHMSAVSALNLLLDPASRQEYKVTIPEGFTAAKVFSRLSQTTGKPVGDFEAATKDPAVGLPPEAGGSVEGYLFPATYDFNLDTTPAAMLAAMVSRAQQAMQAAGVPVDPAQRHIVLTKASIVQAEAGNTEDMGKIARVLENRLADGTPLQLDTTVNYATGKFGITTTAADRASDSPYNTYLHAGLPPGPISSPGTDALKAVLSPTPGDWRFFVVVNPSTGETLFASTGAEHQKNVAKFQQWLRDHPQG